MPKQNSKRNKRIRNLIIVSSFTAVVLMVSTFAWFIGMRTVGVDSFEITIAATESLWLSLDGETWSPTVSISENTFSPAKYTTNTNSWGGAGLVPMSTIGEMDLAASRMKLFEKASLTTSPGGYRLLASRVKNYESDGDGGFVDEKSGYVVFDLFVRNFSGRQYLTNLNELDEEAIYLTVDSKVEVGGTGVSDTGIENSVRVAFAQIGRVEGTTEAWNTVRGITCTTDANVTGICRTAQIWEPNDTAHVASAISWYNTSCLKRKSALITDPDSFEGLCNPVIDGIANSTYAIKTDITSGNQVDIYDGKEYNGYENSSAYLEAYDYFTDTQKVLAGTQRPTFMTLAPNSITKIRVYVYLEGQDIDNYDFASIGKQIKVNFGFTKERFTEADIDYSGSDLNQGDGPNGADLTAPRLTLVGDSPMNVELDATFEDPGVTVTDNVTPSENIVIKAKGKVDTENAGEYRITYTATDAAGNVGTIVRTVIVAPAETPETPEP